MLQDASLLNICMVYSLLLILAYVNDFFLNICNLLEKSINREKFCGLSKKIRNVCLFFSDIPDFRRILILNLTNSKFPFCNISLNIYQAQVILYIFHLLQKIFLIDICKYISIIVMAVIIHSGIYHKACIINIAKIRMVVSAHSIKMPPALPNIH